MESIKELTGYTPAEARAAGATLAPEEIRTVQRVAIQHLAEAVGPTESLRRANEYIAMRRREAAERGEGYSGCIRWSLDRYIVVE